MSGTLLIMAGGTGGHIMPGLAIAKAMRARGWMVRWLGTQHGMENRLVPEAGIDLDTVAFAGLRGKGLGQAVFGCMQLFLAGLRSLQLLRQIRPTVVLGMGGYVTVPGGLASVVTRCPLVLVNADARLLLSNRLLAPFARRVLYGLPPERALKARESYVGAPVREAIAAIVAPDQRYAGRSGPLHLLVLGGSLGAATLNLLVPEAIASLPLAQRPVITHQSGQAHLDALTARYRSLGVAATTLAFVEDMAACYSAADVVLCRAGAITVNELAAGGIASILVPLVVSTTAHQVDNARLMVNAGAALMIAPAELSSTRLAELIASLDRERLIAMAKRAQTLGRPQATEALAELLVVTAKEAQRS